MNSIVSLANDCMLLVSDHIPEIYMLPMAKAQAQGHSGRKKE
jgi:hypothetical protein